MEILFINAFVNTGQNFSVCLPLCKLLRCLKF